VAEVKGRISKLERFHSAGFAKEIKRTGSFFGTLRQRFYMRRAQPQKELSILGSPCPGRRQKPLLREYRTNLGFI